MLILLQLFPGVAETAGDAQCLADTISHICRDPQIPGTGRRYRSGIVGTVSEESLFLLGGAHIDGELPLFELPAADVDNLHLLGSLAARAIGHDPNDVYAARERDVSKLVAALDWLRLAAAQQVVDIKLHIKAERQFAAQIDPPEHARLGQWHGA